MGHDHAHHVGDYNRAFALGVTLNLGFVVVEFFFGLLSDSLALLADAGHNLSDVAGLLLAWGASYLAKAPATANRTYGWRKVPVMASLLSSLMLLVATGALGWEAFQRLFAPQSVTSLTIIVVAGVGVLVNTATALLFVSGQHHDLNLRAAFLHMAADAGISLVVVLGGLLMLWQELPWVDPVLCLLVASFIIFSSWGLLKDSLNYALDAVPRNIDVQGIRQYLVNLDQVDRLHDLHVWPLSTSEVALTVHLVIHQQSLDNALLHQIQQHLHDHFEIEHATIQLESSLEESNCLLAPTTGH